MSSTAHRPPSAVQCRLAIWSDINAMAEIAAQAFDQNDLCGRYMHPHRHEFPDDYIRFFRQETRSSFFEPGVWFLVTTAIVDEGEEIGVDESRNEEHVGSDERPKQEVRVSVKEEKKEVEQQTGKKVGEKMEKKEGQRVIVVGAAKWKRQGKGRRRYSSWMNGMSDMCFSISMPTNTPLPRTPSQYIALPTPLFLQPPLPHPPSHSPLFPFPANPLLTSSSPPPSPPPSPHQIPNLPLFLPLPHPLRQPPRRLSPLNGLLPHRPPLLDRPPRRNFFSRHALRRPRASASRTRPRDGTMGQRSRGGRKGVCESDERGGKGRVL